MPFFHFLSAFQLLFIARIFLSLSNKKYKPLLEKPRTPECSSIWTLEDYCIVFYSAIWAFLRLADTCVLARKMRVLSQRRDSSSFMWNYWFQRDHTVENVRPDFFDSLPARCSGSSVGVLLFCVSLFACIFFCNTVEQGFLIIRLDELLRYCCTERLGT